MSQRQTGKDGYCDSDKQEKMDNVTETLEKADNVTNNQETVDNVTETHMKSCVM